MTIALSFAQFLNAEPPILTKLLGSVIDFKLVHSSKTLLPKVVTLSGIETVVK